jgi:DEAD/DEAH box helicase domain-containing protein
MLTLQQAYEVKASIIEYLKATFTFKDRKLNEEFLRFINGMFKGPYISLKLPFVKANPTEEIPLEIKPPFTPFFHQLQAFKRLTTENNNEPKATLLTTGTGSGKTEAFLYPILDYCYKNKDIDGIKVIVLYPMNALATDQAKRIAEIIYNDSRLKDQIRAGLFIGESQDRKKSYPKVMGKEHIIENRDEIVQAPPDILLTNFKMLDFALMQSRYHNLWLRNYAKPDLLKYLVLDELHTYEGAQGSDVANLIRRLKLKLEIPDNHLCCIGTSATIGKGPESNTLLCDFATKVFGEEFKEESIIQEHRQSLSEFFGDGEHNDYIPPIDKLNEAVFKSGDTFNSFIKRQLAAWGIDPDISQTELSNKLKNYKIIQDLLIITSSEILTVDELIIKLNSENKTFGDIDDKNSHNTSKEIIIRSILSLISYAKSGDTKNQFPFLYLQIQLWIREMSGFTRKVDPVPQFLWREDIDSSSGEKAFPSFYCRECGASGWIAVKQENRDRIEDDINDIYLKFFSHHKNLYLVTPFSEENKCIEEYEPSDTIEDYLNTRTLTLSQRENENSFKILAYRKLSKNYNLHICPQCNTRNTINIIGQRVATLISVGISQLLSTDLDPNTEKYRKVLAFTHGVQDAAHQAGFMEARNYRFTFRTAIQKVINQLGKLVSLSELNTAFIDYWSKNADEAGKNHLEAYYNKFFPPDHQADVSIERHKKRPKEFFEEFNNRVGWEIASEFGYNAIIGRTLEKTGSSAAFFDAKKLQDVFTHVKPWLDENALENITEEEFLRFLIVFLHRLRVRGGVDHIYLNKFRTGRSSYYLITQNVNNNYFLIRNFGKDTRLPKFITDQTNRFGVFDLTTRTVATNWYHTYFKKAFPLMPDNADLVNEFYTKLLETLSLDGIRLLDVKDAQGIRNYSLQPDELYVDNDVRVCECRECSHRISSTPANINLISDSKCMVYRCTGSYEETENGTLNNYYKQVYNRGRAPRVYSADHTGMLDRRVREEMEIDYKERPKFNSKNVLVATSTLEMGIDIGSLNSAINSSIPPLPSNYLQRIGRAGRSTGSAIVLNFVPNDAHDLYYYESPLEMMDGLINTPGCYLEAKEIIRRHYFAYCIDQWTKSNPGRNTIPGQLRFLRLEQLNIDDSTFFLNSIISFIKKNEKELFDRFKQSFKEEVSDDIFNELKVQINTNRLFDTIKEAFKKVKNEIIILKDKLKDINEYVKLKKLDVNDPEYIELKRDHRNIAASIGLIRRRSVIEHMINEGLLPNYAFPEKGVVLKAQVFRRKDDDPKHYDRTSLEIVRPARSALRELVPDNLFYTQGYKLPVSGLNVASWRDEAIDYRFCSHCDNIDIDIPPLADRCAKCGSDSWKSSHNTHKAIRLSAVASFTDEKKARIDDGAETREPVISRITQHFKFDPQSVRGSWVMLKIPFGIEYISDVTIIEMNEGLLNSKLPQNNNITINGSEVPKPGYIICRYCGKATTSVYDEKYEPIKTEDYHFGFCKNKSKGYQNKSDDVFEEVFLYRKMNTEAIKILLPVQEFNTESAIKLFKAGINFGLRKYFRGKPDHLMISEYSEYNQQTQKNDRYLVLYDIIPGGTGYLGKLFDKDEINFILQEAYINIRDCDCQYTRKDGCYNCIYTYGNQFEREELSRNKAEELFGRIVRSSNEWEYLTGGLGEVTNSGQIEESELEERFIKTLTEYYNNEKRQNSRLSVVTKEGTTKYNLQIVNNGKRLTYDITPQVELGPDDGVRYTTVADFLITLISINNTDNNEEFVPGDRKQIAVYLDGYQYHASAENNRFIADIEKRRSLLESNKYIVWTLTWRDLELFGDILIDCVESSNDHLKDTLEGEIPAKVRQNINKHPLLNSHNSTLDRTRNNMERLIWLLENYDSESYGSDSLKYSFKFQSDYPENCISAESADSFLRSQNVSFADIAKGSFTEGYLYIDLLPKDTSYEFRILQKLKTLEYLGAIFVKAKEKEYDKMGWEIFWLAFNITQFGYENINIHYVDRREKLPEYDEILENFESKYHPLVKNLIKKNIEFNQNDYYSLKNNEGIIVAEAFIGLPKHKIIIDPLSEESKKGFQREGYTVYSFDEFDQSII